MTQKEKSLLLKDLSTRVLYKVRLEGHVFPFIVLTPDQLLFMYTHQGFAIRRPYLRPLSSMTEEERNNLRAYCRTQEGIIYDIGVSGAINSPAIIDWLNKNHFDYRGLIPMGLALVAPEGMYK